MNKHTPQEVILEGFHVCKHAIRNGAVITDLVTSNKELLKQMSNLLAPDIWKFLDTQVREISDNEFAKYSDVQIRTPLAARGIVAEYDATTFDLQAPVILLDRPRDLENIGAVVRAAAGLRAAGVYTTGEHNPWHKNSVRTSQGTHFAIPVIHLGAKHPSNLIDLRPVYVFDESGDDMSTMNIPNNAVLVFGSERFGVGDEWLKKADRVVRIPQSTAISSYNLATSVAMSLYHAKHIHTNLGK